MDDYTRIATILRALDAGYPARPDLASLAARAGLSPGHFQRLFLRWAGVSPKAFLQCLRLNHARRALLRGAGVLEASLATGLSGPGRLHDLCVNLQAASPGEIKTGGAGWTLFAGFAGTPFGRCLIVESPRGLCHLAFIDASSEHALTHVQAEWPAARLQRDDDRAGVWATRIFSPRPDAPTLAAYVRGSQFQVRVWRALLEIPPGTTHAYGRLAAEMGRPGAARAVGGAVAANPLAYLIPCHRVIRETGVVGDYRWGSLRKRIMLTHEACLSAKRGPVD
jgi:AraC family transcriptional regulator of adaptative response/methylated-DNA-[protein]-cysteine methyltransferase